MSLIAYIREELQVIKERDPAIKSNMEILLYPSFKVMIRYRLAHKLYLRKHYFLARWISQRAARKTGIEIHPMEILLYPSFKVMIRYRLAHKLYLRKHYFLARWISQRAARKTGIEIHPGATIGKGLFIDHGSGVIIGETTVIGNNVTLYQGVTLGGTGKEKGKRHPTLEDNVMVSAGAKILGSFTIGENAKIGAGSVVLEEVPPNCTVVGVPGRIVRMGNQKMPRTDLDQIHLPDPVLNDIRELQNRNIQLHKELKEMEKDMRCRKHKNQEEKDESI